MATEKQTNANRRNAEKSTGPRTEEGKQTSSLNAYKHGLTGQRVIMTAEEAEARDRFTDGILGDLKPVGAMEESLAQSIADSQWRIHRAVAIEDNIFAAEAWNEENHASEKESDYDAVDRALAPMRSFTRDPQRFHLLTTYEMRLHRKSQADLKQLRELQVTRRASEETSRPANPRPRNTTVQPPDLKELKPQNGFVFSGPHSEAEIADFLAVSSASRPAQTDSPTPVAATQMEMSQ